MPHDFALTVSGTVQTPHNPFECLMRCQALASMVVARNGHQVSLVSGVTDLAVTNHRYMKNLAISLVNALLDSDQFVDALTHPEASAPATARELSRAPTPRLLAVLPLTIREHAMDRPTRETFEEAIRTVAGDVLSKDGFTVLTGENTLRILADNGVDPEKVCDATCALDAARELNASLFLSGSVAKEGSGYIVFIRLFSEERGQQLSSLQLEGTSPRELRHRFDAQARAFFRRALNLSGF